MKKITVTLFCILIFNACKTQTIDTLIDVGGHKIAFQYIKGKGTPILLNQVMVMMEVFGN